ncbi:tetratricopeptide repeat protein [Helicobacter salomonis]|uniref:tetratricopeptide repeat protein n=1 Tax=Helicobacter salomonis TaxID=56878 RepID=UPI0013152CF7|nr:SEL1-like repeat protein [Helicobacter salomonis]
MKPRSPLKLESPNFSYGRVCQYELAREHYKKEDEITNDFFDPTQYKQNVGEIITGLGNADDLGFMHASFQLARMATLGLGMPKDFKKAFKFYEDVLWFPNCAQIFGSYEYGFLKENFSLLEYYSDYNRYWLVKEYGSHSNVFDVVGDFARTFYELGKMYQQGLGTHKNAKKALAYFKKAAELGSQEAILALKKQEKH